MARARIRVSVTAAVVFSLIGSTACYEELTRQNDTPEGHAALRFQASVIGTAITGLAIRVSADDIPEALAYNIPVKNDIGAGTIKVPAGSARRIEVRAFDSGGVQTHEGVEVVDVVAGTNPTVSISLEPLTGDIPVVVTLGSWSVTIEPQKTELMATAKLKLTARVYDGEGNEVTRDVTWASTNPSIMTVDADGTVLAVLAGEAFIVASYADARAVLALTVTPLKWSKVDGGARHVCGLDQDGAAFCWGRNEHGQLGSGTTGGSSARPVRVVGDHVFEKITVGGRQSCGITEDGQAYCWGRGLGGSPDSPTPQLLAGDFVWQRIDMGTQHACGISSSPNSGAYCWGEGRDGRLGHGLEQSSAEPVLVDVPPLSSITAGYQHSCALAYGPFGGSVYCWGAGESGQLGDGLMTSSSVPVEVDGGPYYWQVSAGGAHTCTARIGEIYCWGRGTEGQLGNGAVTTSGTPVLADHAFGPGTLLPSAVANHTCVVEVSQDANQVHCWGYGSGGQLGDGSTPPNAPRGVLVGDGLALRSVTTAGVPWSTIADGSGTSCGVGVDDYLYCWGSNDHGEVGDGSLVDRALPVRVMDPVP